MICQVKEAVAEVKEHNSFVEARSLDLNNSTSTIKSSRLSPGCIAEQQGPKCAERHAASLPKYKHSYLNTNTVKAQATNLLLPLMTVESESGTYRPIAPLLFDQLHRPGERLSFVHVHSHFIPIYDFHTSQALTAETMVPKSGGPARPGVGSRLPDSLINKRLVSEKKSQRHTAAFVLGGD